ncbi:CpsD/CapB family tyrosine-protein kinase [Paenibacillus alkalitolerans]|uniref:CpsD/CapB family tyrosine-protein kinase n=1 Tax=Paenibacillus alkalitolerans TaxID=2799335 RepID=UPI0018F2A6E9|nr:CpsD/CapB family tyrosine-protein kinase [Paenibacillus alkalitolerans]
MSRLMRKRGLIAGTSPKSAVSEAYRSLRANIEFSNRDETLKTIAITSALSGEGKSTVSSNIAVAYAQANRNVLLIDADLRTPVQHQIFELSNHIGLSTALAMRSEIGDVIQKSNIDNLQLITAGPIPPNPSELLDSIPMASLLGMAKEMFDIVIIDTPAITMFADALVVANKCDGVVLVMNSGKVKNEIAIKAKESLEYGKATIIGAVLNNVSG